MISDVTKFRGQSTAIKLLNQYKMQQKLAGTVLLLGQRGLGKTTLATIIARALTCENNESNELKFCGTCYACKSIEQGEQPEYVVVRPRSKQITVEQIEEDHDNFRSASMHPVLMSHRIYVIDDAHYLNVQTGNQMLKLFEEAPKGTIFILVTDKPDDLLPTIRSRGQKIRLTPEATAELAPMVSEDAMVSMDEALEATKMAAGRYTEACQLAQNSSWRRAVSNLAGKLFTGANLSMAVSDLSGYEYEYLWTKMLNDYELDEDSAARMINKAKTPVEKGLKTRQKELERQALIAALDRSAWWALNSGTPPAQFHEAFYNLKKRINQNVDIEMAQTAFELALS